MKLLCITNIKGKNNKNIYGSVIISGHTKNTQFMYPAWDIRNATFVAGSKYIYSQILSEYNGTINVGTHDFEF